MTSKKRDIFIKLENYDEVSTQVREIKEYKKELEKLFQRYDDLNKIENKTFENWETHLEDISQKIEYITL